MEFVIDVIKSWDSLSQQVVFTTMGITAMLSVVCICSSLFKALRLMVCGYPPLPEPPNSPSARQCCEHDDNLTGHCLKADGCRTQAECDQMIQLHTVRPSGK